MDFSIRHIFAGISFKPNKLGTVKWATVQKILASGKVECSWYTYDDQLSSGTTTASAQSVLREGDMLAPSRCYMSEHKDYGNPRYAHKRFIRVSFHGNSFVTLYDLGDLAELADGSEVEESEVDEACQACVGCDAVPEEPPALVTKKHLSLIVYNPDIP